MKLLLHILLEKILQVKKFYFAQVKMIIRMNSKENK